MEHIVEHEIYGKVVFNTDTQTFKCIDYKKIYGEDLDTLKENIGNIKFFNYNKKKCRYFDSVFDFLESSVSIAVVPFTCIGKKPIKRRTMATLLDINNRIIELYNVELIDGRWAKNNITNLYNSKCYFCIIEKNEKAINDFLLLSTLEIKEGMTSIPS